MEPDFKRAGCTIQISGSESLGKWDYARLEQVIVNLLTNAMKYAPGKPVEIKITESEKDVVCEVRDHGKGIAEADRARIFQLFERASDQEGGLGLGLYIVRQIVESHQGSISVESSMGNGTSFSVRLPKNI